MNQDRSLQVRLAPGAPSGADRAPLPLALPRLLTVSEVAAALQISRKTVCRLAAARRLPCVRFGRALRFDAGDVLAWLSARKEG